MDYEGYVCLFVCCVCLFVSLAVPVVFLAVVRALCFLSGLANLRLSGMQGLCARIKIHAVIHALQERDIPGLWLGGIAK